MSAADRRLVPLEPTEFGSEAARLLGTTLDRVAALEGNESAPRQVLNILRTLAHHPHLLGPFLGFATALASGALPRRSSELLALRAAWNCHSDFEWGHHAVYARAAGLNEAEIASVAEGPAAPGWSEGDRVLLRAADELHAQQDLSEATWRALESTHSAEQLVEIPFVVGQYTMLSMVANATGVPVEAGLDPLPDRPEKR
jgi:4-carboxymuconolactone decarboxylase